MADAEKNKIACNKWRSKNIEKERERGRLKGKRSGKDYHLRTRYGITLEDVRTMLKEQGDKCKICKTTDHGGRGWSVDHDHATGKIRGILCFHCNVAIGCLKDNANLVYDAACYLRDAAKGE